VDGTYRRLGAGHEDAVIFAAQIGIWIWHGAQAVDDCCCSRSVFDFRKNQISCDL
jgi:hypothetical protein